MSKKNVDTKKQKKNIDVTKKEKMSPAFMTVLIILVVILVILIITRIGNLPTDGKEVKELYSYFDTQGEAYCENFAIYSDAEVNYDNLDDNTKICIAYHKVDLKNEEFLTANDESKKETCVVDDMTFRKDEDSNTTCTYYKVNKDKINSSYAKIFGHDLKVEESFRPDTFHICYVKDDAYYCGLSESYSYTIGNESTIYRVVDQAKKEKDTITIYDYFIKIKNDTCYLTYTKTRTNTKCNDNLSKVKDNKFTYDFLKQNALKYKHVYKKDKNGNYYWVSSTPENLDNF